MSTVTNTVKKTRKPRAQYKPHPNSNQDKFLKHFGKQIQEYESFQRSTQGLSKGTQYLYKFYMSNFCLYTGEDPDTIINNRKNDFAPGADLLNIERYERKVKEYLRTIEYKNLNLSPTISYICGFFTNNSKRLSLDLGNLKYSKLRKKKKYSPNCEEVTKILSFADTSRDKAIVIFAYHLGLTPADISVFKIGDYPLEPWVYCKNRRQKNGSVWHGASTPEGVKAYRDYLVIRKGVKDEPLFIGRNGDPLNANAISDTLSLLISRAGLENVEGLTPKSFRDGRFDALIDAGIDLQTREAMMGHVNNIYHHYGSDKKLQERMVEAMRKVYPLIKLTDDTISNVGSGLDEATLKRLVSLLPAIERFVALENKKEETISDNVKNR
jgi:integrase